MSRLAAVLVAALIATPFVAPTADAAEPAEPMPPPSPAGRAAERLAGHPATLVVVDAGDGSTLVRIDPGRAATPMPPCSTFKIPNALIALAAGAVTLQDNAIRRDRQAVPAEEWWPRRWDQDHDLTSAIRNSVVWYFQELARRVGEAEMQRRLDELGYGNRDVSGGIDRFWLSSSLLISADAQVDFLRRLVRGELPFDAAHVAFVRDALRLDSGPAAGAEPEEENGAWDLFGKTGSCELPSGAWVGWLVGWVERPPAKYVYAFNVEAPSYREMTELRSALVRPSLADLGLLAPKVSPTPSPPTP